MITIGLTGGSGCGKSTVAQLLVNHGARWINADAVYHELIENPTPCASAIIEKFGKNIMAEVGSVDRRALASIVFAKTEEGKSALSELNRITHAFVREECIKRLSKYEKENAIATVLDVPLLFESGFDTLCDTTVAVLAPQDLRLARILTRDGISENEAERRIAAQPTDSYYQERANYLIINDGDLKKLKEQVTQLFEQLSIK